MPVEVTATSVAPASDSTPDTASSAQTDAAASRKESPSNSSTPNVDNAESPSADTSGAAAAGPTLAAAPTTESLSGSEIPGQDLALGLSRGDRLFTGVLAAVMLALLAVHWVMLTGWGVRPVDVVRQVPRSFAYAMDINTATWVELSQLDEIGEVLARRIVEDREANGPFASVDDLRRVKRIGPATLKKIRPWVRASGQEDD